MLRVFMGLFVIAHGLVTFAIWTAPVTETAPFNPSHPWVLGHIRALAIILAVKARHAPAAALALAGGSLALVAATRRWHQHWGATDEEIARPLPGDDLIPDPMLDSTQAITIHAPSDRIWPWLAQAGYDGRAGFYSYDVLERRFGARNTNRLNPELEPLKAGDTMPFYPGMPMTVAIADPPHALVLWLVTTANKAIDPTDHGPRSMLPGAGRSYSNPSTRVPRGCSPACGSPTGPRPSGARTRICC